MTHPALDRDRPLRGLLYGDVNLNLIDGSAIWATSMAEAMASAGLETKLILKSRVVNDRLVAPLKSIPGLTVVSPIDEGVLSARSGSMSVPQAVKVLVGLDVAERFDLIIVRGRKLVEALVTNRQFNGRLWSYLTDIPQSLGEMTKSDQISLSRIAKHSQVLLCQTEDLRSFLEACVDNTRGKCKLWPPVVPIAAPEFGATRGMVGEPAEGEAWRLVYLGKFAPRWNTEEMTKLPKAFGSKRGRVEIHMVGDKIHDDRSDPEFAQRMRQSLDSADGVIWHGGMGRAEAMALAAQMHFGLSWRDSSLDSSLELSTKVLEFGLLGVPPVINRTPMHEALFGPDYPLFANEESEVVDVISKAMRDSKVRKKAAAVARQVSEPFGMRAATARLKSYLAEEFPQTPEPLTLLAKPLKVVVASHDWKFFGEILTYLSSLSNVEVRVDSWRSLNDHDAEQSRAMIDWADVVICEWAGPNAVWYAKHKKSHQRLIVRLHRFELSAAWLDSLPAEKVDQLICVSEPYAELAKARLGINEEKVAVISNYVSDRDLDRPKLANARFHLGVIGAVPQRKRLDRALDILEMLRRRDDRYLLMIKTQMPWDLWWVWRRDAERDYFAQLFARLNTSPHLRDSVVFDRYGSDVATWLRRVGWVLSTSDDESFHLSPAEGMASGAVPVITGWQGSDAIYSPEWIFSDVDSAARFIWSSNEKGVWPELSAQAKSQARASFGLAEVLDDWGSLISSQVS